jgi:hypothetical protein
MERNDKYKVGITIYQISHIIVTNPEAVKIPLHKMNTYNFGGAYLNACFTLETSEIECKLLHFWFLLIPVKPLVYT